MPGPGGPPNYNSARNAIADYAFPGHRVTDKFVAQMPLRVSSTRGLGAYANIFANESFMDELAHAAGADPVEFRLRHMAEPRYREALQAVADRFGWADWQPQEGRGRGVAGAAAASGAAAAGAGAGAGAGLAGAPVSSPASGNSGDGSVAESTMR